MRVIIPLFAVSTVALGAVIRKDSSAPAEDDSITVALTRDTDPSSIEFLPLIELHDDETPTEVIFYADPDFGGKRWGLTPWPDQPSSPTAPGQHCYFVDPGTVSSLKLAKQPDNRRFSCRFYRSTDECQHNKPALTLDYPAEVPSLEKDLDNQIQAALCWWTSAVEQNAATSGRKAIQLREPISVNASIANTMDDRKVFRLY
ncbi:hypothetical protein N0V90_005048 [Kalmusia sp. IMI 367209]|nr:hypothetical protein N0V90_005048 [Kalmusia sp. IMI 367209]